MILDVCGLMSVFTCCRHTPLMFGIEQDVSVSVTLLPVPCSEEALIDSMSDVIMDLALNLTIKKAGCEGTRKHFETIGYFFFHINENGVKVSEILPWLLLLALSNNKKS